MEHELKQRLNALLAEADHCSELMDRTDYQHVVMRLSAATRQLIKAYRRLEQERDELAGRLNRAPHVTQHQPVMDSLEYDAQPQN